MTSITLYTKNGCPQCRMTKHFLETHNLDFVEHNINDEPEFIDYLKNQGFQSVPVLEAENLKPFSGFRPAELQKLAI